jgi:hypothetical protein
MKLTTFLYKTARLSADLSAATSGHPKRIVRRVKNHVVGRALARAGFWRALWR